MGFESLKKSPIEFDIPYLDYPVNAASVTTRNDFKSSQRATIMIQSKILHSDNDNDINLYFVNSNLKCLSPNK